MVLYSEPEFLLPLGVSFSRPGQTLKMRGSATKSREQGRLTGEIFVNYPLQGYSILKNLKKVEPAYMKDEHWKMVFFSYQFLLISISTN